MPYYIKDVVYDREAINDQIKGPVEPSILGRQCFVNSTPSSQTAKKSWSATKAEKANWNVGVSTTWGVSVEASFGVEGIGEAGYSANFGQTYDNSKGGETSGSTTVSDDLDTVVPPWTNIMTTFEANERNLNILFTYKMIHYHGDNKSDVASVKNFSSVFEGVSWSNGNVRWEVVEDCGDSLITQLGRPEERGSNPNEQPPTPSTSNGTPVHTWVAIPNGGGFKWAGNNTWYELGPNGNRAFTFEVLSHSNSQTRLRDINRNILIVLDYNRNKVQYASNPQGTPRDLYDIVNKH